MAPGEINNDKGDLNFNQISDGLLPWVPEVLFLSRAAGCFGVGRRPTDLRAGHYWGLTATGKRT